MKKHYQYIIISAIVLTGLFIIILRTGVPSNFKNSTTPAAIFPDYTNISIPVNMAPLNFKINDGASKTIAVFSNGEMKFNVKSDNSKIEIPISKWKKLLKKSAGKSISINIYSKTAGTQWVKYPTISNRVEVDEIDNYMVFRSISAGYILWEKMGIYQRNLTNFDQSPILLNSETNENCMSCHTFCKNDPSKMVLHLRSKPGGTLISNNGEIKLVDLKTNYTMSAGVYPSWHPDGKKIAFSVNLIKQKFHSADKKEINVYDIASDIIVYDIEKNIVTTSPKLSTGSLENLPVWSPDGEYLYYISAPKFDKTAPASDAMYDLLRIKYNTATGQWGNVDTLLSTKNTGKSISFPEISPDGKHLVFCMADYGYFTIFHQSSDLYIMNLDNFSYSKLAVNSESIESFHSWSSNGKWLSFVSKRLDGLYSQVYFSQIDEKGNASKPFILPQKDPDFYSTYALNYNRPEFIKDKVSVESYKLAEKAFSKAIKAQFDPKVEVNALSGATRLEPVNEHTNY